MRADMQAAHENSVDIIVSLVEQHEVDAVGTCSLAEACALFHMKSIHYEIRDKWIPTDSGRFIEHVLLPIIAALQAGQKVLVHCNGGKGRTGTAVAAVLMSSWVGNEDRCTFDEAIFRMRSVRDGMLKNPLQQFYIWHLSSLIATLHLDSEAAEAAVLVTNVPCDVESAALYSTLRGDCDLQIVHLDLFIPEAGSAATQAVVCYAEPSMAKRAIDLLNNTTPFTGVPLSLVPYTREAMSDSVCASPIPSVDQDVVDIARTFLAEAVAKTEAALRDPKHIPTMSLDEIRVADLETISKWFREELHQPEELMLSMPEGTLRDYFEGARFNTPKRGYIMAVKAVVKEIKTLIGSWSVALADAVAKQHGWAGIRGSDQQHSDGRDWLLLRYGKEFESSEIAKFASEYQHQVPSSFHT